MKLDSYKYAYPRTLLADVLALLIEQRGIDFATLAHLSGVNRGTIHGIACAKRSCDLETRRAILAPLVTCDGHAQRLALLFDREAETLLTVPEVVTSIEPTLAARRQRALAEGLDIGALGGRYGLNEIYSDALAMERAGRGNVACRWASYLVAAAQKHGTPQTELRAGIFSARLHLACSRFAECRAAIMSILRRCGPPLPDAVNILNIDAIPSQVHAQVILGWLEYELGRYDEAFRNLNAAIVAIAGAGPEAHGDYGFPLSLALLNALKDRGDSQCVAGERFGRFAYRVSRPHRRKHH